MASSTKALRELRDFISGITPEFEVETTRKCHIKVKLFRGGKCGCVIVGGTPSDHRAMMNIKSDIRRTYAALA